MSSELLPILPYVKQITGPGSMHERGCSGLVHWDDPEGLKNFPWFIVIYKVSKAEVDIFLELSCFFHDPADVGNLISGSSAFSKSSWNIWTQPGSGRDGMRFVDSQAYTLYHLSCQERRKSDKYLLLPVNY